jgi:hypothetical protein
MNIRQTTLAAALALAFIGPAHAEGLKPFQGQVIDLGDVSAVAYYTIERDGFRVVATLAKKPRVHRKSLSKCIKITVRVRAVESAHQAHDAVRPVT